MLFTFDDGFPKDQREDEAEKVLAARRRGQSTSVVVPDGMHVHMREGADREWHPIEPLRGRGQPPKTPAGTWEDDDLFDKVKAILGDLDERQHNGPEVADALCLLAREVLGRQRFKNEHRDVLRSLALKATALKVASLEITRQLRVWQHDLTDPAVRRMQSRKPVAHDFTALVLKYEAEQPLLDEHGKPVCDEDGRPILVRPPVCDDEGQPILWVPDEHGHPSRPYVTGEPLPRRPMKAVRPRVKMIFR